MVGAVAGRFQALADVVVQVQVHRAEQLVELRDGAGATTGIIGGWPCMSQASTNWLGVAPSSAATSRRTASRAWLLGWS